MAEDIAELCNHILDGDYGELINETQYGEIIEEIDRLHHCKKEPHTGKYWEGYHDALRKVTDFINKLN